MRVNLAYVDRHHCDCPNWDTRLYFDLHKRCKLRWFQRIRLEVDRQNVIAPLNPPRHKRLSVNNSAMDHFRTVQPNIGEISVSCSISSSEKAATDNLHNIIHSSPTEWEWRLFISPKKRWCLNDKYNWDRKVFRCCLLWKWFSCALQWRSSIVGFV